VKQRRDCGSHRISRRHFLFGSAALPPLFLVDPAQAAETAAAAALRNTAKACVFLNLSGAPSHLDTFDPKEGPWNPPGARIDEFAGGVRLSRRFFPNLSAVASELCIIRSAASWEAAHSRGQFSLQTAHPLNPARAFEIPHIGAVVAYERRNVNSLLPPFFAFNDVALKGAAFLGGKAEPFMPESTGNGFSALRHYGEATRATFDRRLALLAGLDGPLRSDPRSPEMAAWRDMMSYASTLPYSADVEAAFVLEAADRTRYGDTGLGRALALTRNVLRLRKGAAFINITQTGWDTHDRMFEPANSFGFLPRVAELDQAVAAFLMDLRSLGLLRETLVVLMGEFGRTPGDLNGRGGRDHYRQAMSVALAGGGVAGGRVIGATDARGAEITDPGWRAQRPVYPEDIACTIYSALGIDYTKSITDTPSGGRFDYTRTGPEEFGPVEEVFA
jgi:hypothetical protein